MGADFVPRDLTGESPRTEGHQQQERLSFDDVYLLHGRDIYNFLCFQLGGIDAADDVFAVVCERIFLNLSRYNPRRAPLSRWLFAIARNAVIDSRRRRPRMEHLQLSALPEPSSRDPSPEEAVLHKEEMARLAGLVGELTRRERDVVSLKFGGGMSNRDIAASLGLREGHVAVILHRAIHHLRGLLESEESK